MRFWERHLSCASLWLAPRSSASPCSLAAGLTEQVVDGLRKQGDLSAAYIRCVERDLHFNLAISGLAREALKGRVTEIGAYALAAVVKQVHKGCKGK